MIMKGRQFLRLWLELLTLQRGESALFIKDQTRTKTRFNVYQIVTNGQLKFNRLPSAARAVRML